MTARTSPTARGLEHGDDARRAALAAGVEPGAILDLAVSTNPVAPPVVDVLRRHLETVARYPDPARATDALAEVLGAAPGELLLTNGGSEAIALVAAELGSGRVEEPEFALYRRHLTTLDDDAGRWRSNPNNPTGRLAGATEHAAVWDEAFYPLAAGVMTRGDHRRGSVVVGSLTKVFACPGLRVGYVLSADAQFVARVAGRQPQWSVGSLACAALPELLARADPAGWRREIALLRSELVATLARHGLSAEPSDANFVLVRSAPDGLAAALAKDGILVRDCASFGLPGALRIAVPRYEDLGRLAEGLSAVLEGRPASRVRMRGGSPPARPASAEVGRWRGAVMVCGTASDVGKSVVVAALCRLLGRSGVRVAPFKAQNMSLNSYATAAGHEISRAQAVQALAAGVEPEVAMNPILLKPTGERSSQVVVLGRPWGVLDARAYSEAKAQLRPIVLESLATLRERFDVVVCEGAGSPAEVNLLAHDLVNLGLAREAGIRALLVGDIDRGGVLAAVLGTVALLPGDLRALIGGVLINKFRGDEALLAPGLTELERRTGVPVLGVLPYLDGLAVDAEDSLALGGLPGGAPPGAENIDVAVVRLPHIANFTDLDGLRLERGVSLRFVGDAAALGDPDLIVLPGSKTTVADLDWLRSVGLAEGLRAAAARAGGPTILGLCAGYQMLGRVIIDHVESHAGEVAGLGLLRVSTVFDAEKTVRQVEGRALGVRVHGYEIRHGEPVREGAGRGDDEPWIARGERPPDEGARRGDGRVLGTSLHGLFESDDFRTAFLVEVAARRNKAFAASGARFAEARAGRLERFADEIAARVDLEALGAIVAAAGQAKGRS